MISSSNVSCCNNYCCAIDCVLATVQLWLTAVTTAPATLKSHNFFFWIKTKNQLKKSLILLKTFAHLLIIPLIKSYLITYLVLYEEDQATTWHTHYPIIYSLSYSLTLKLHHFAVHKHIPISFSISLTKSLFLESNITHDITQKTTLATIISSCIYYIYINISHTSIYFTNIFLTKYP